MTWQALLESGFKSDAGGFSRMVADSLSARAMAAGHPGYDWTPVIKTLIDSNAANSPDKLPAQWTIDSPPAAILRDIFAVGNAGPEYSGPGYGATREWDTRQTQVDPNEIAAQVSYLDAEKRRTADTGSGFGTALAVAAAAALAYFSGGASLAAEATAAETVAATAAEASAFEAWAFVPATEATVSPATWAAFGNAASTADAYAAATASAINTSVADYTAAAVAGESVGASSAFSLLPVSSLGPAVSSGFLADAVEIARGAKTAVDTIRIVNAVTRQQSIIPRNAPVPVGWAVDAGWSPSLGDIGAKYSYDPASGALMLQSSAVPADTAAAVPAAGAVSPFLALAALAGAVLYLVK